MSATDDRVFVFTRPDGTSIEQTVRFCAKGIVQPSGADGEPSQYAMNRRRGLTIGMET